MDLQFAEGDRVLCNVDDLDLFNFQLDEYQMLPRGIILVITEVDDEDEEYPYRVTVDGQEELYESAWCGEADVVALNMENE